MRVTTLLNKVLGLPGLWVRGVEFRGRIVVIFVEPRFRRLTCSVCGTRVRGRFERTRRRWRHLSLWGLRTELDGPIRRLRCPTCQAVRTEAVPWARPGSKFTRPFEDVVAFLAQKLNHTEVSGLLGISWATVGSIAERLVAENLEQRRFEGLVRIGVDEISYQHPHKYVTVVLNHDTGKVVWVGEGKSSETLKEFFEQLSPEQLGRIEVVSMDLAAAYQKAVRETLPGADIVFDKFHLAQLAQRALNEVRRSLMRRLEGDEKQRLKRSRWPLLKAPETLNPQQQGKLSEIQRDNAPLYRAYLLKESFLDALASCSTRQEAQAELRSWLCWASRSRLRPFVRLARTIRKHFPGILAMVETGLSNARLEGMNNKIRLLSHRAYGFHSAQALIATIYLCCADVKINAPNLI